MATNAGNAMRDAQLRRMIRSRAGGRATMNWWSGSSTHRSSVHSFGRGAGPFGGQDRFIFTQQALRNEHQWLRRNASTPMMDRSLGTRAGSITSPPDARLIMQVRQNIDRRASYRGPRHDWKSDVPSHSILGGSRERGFTDFQKQGDYRAGRILAPQPRLMGDGNSYLGGARFAPDVSHIVTTDTLEQEVIGRALKGRDPADVEQYISRYKNIINDRNKWLNNKMRGASSRKAFIEEMDLDRAFEDLKKASGRDRIPVVRRIVNAEKHGLKVSGRNVRIDSSAVDINNPKHRSALIRSIARKHGISLKVDGDDFANLAGTGSSRTLTSDDHMHRIIHGKSLITDKNGNRVSVKGRWKAAHRDWKKMTTAYVASSDSFKRDFIAGKYSTFGIVARQVESPFQFSSRMGIIGGDPYQQSLEFFGSNVKRKDIELFTPTVASKKLMNNRISLTPQMGRELSPEPHRFMELRDEASRANGAPFQDFTPEGAMLMGRMGRFAVMGNIRIIDINNMPELAAALPVIKRDTLEIMTSSVLGGAAEVLQRSGIQPHWPGLSSETLKKKRRDPRPMMRTLYLARNMEVRHGNKEDGTDYLKSMVPGAVMLRHVGWFDKRYLGNVSFKQLEAETASGSRPKDASEGLVTMADVAAMHEFGTSSSGKKGKGRGIPERPWLSQVADVYGRVTVELAEKAAWNQIRQFANVAVGSSNRFALRLAQAGNPTGIRMIRGSNFNGPFKVVGSRGRNVRPGSESTYRSTGKGVDSRFDQYRPDKESFNKMMREMEESGSWQRQLKFESGRSSDLGLKGLADDSGMRDYYRNMMDEFSSDKTNFFTSSNRASGSFQNFDNALDRSGLGSLDAFFSNEY